MVWRILKRTFFAFAAILVIMAIVGLFLPSDIRMERSIVIKAPPEAVFPHINNLKNWPAWSPWYAAEPTAEYQYTGPEAGEGATVSWKGEKVGEGKQVIRTSVPWERIETSLDFGPQGRATSHWRFGPTEEGTRVTWGFETHVGLNPLARWSGVLIQKMVGRDYELGLKKLKQVVEREAGQDADGELGTSVGRVAIPLEQTP